MSNIKLFISRLTAVSLLFFFLAALAAAKEIHFIHVSDLHYGLYRDFQGKKHVSAQEVNRTLIDRINALPQETIPGDGGVGAGEAVGYVNFIVNTGDIANRMEKGVQPAAASWRQFITDWTHRLTLKDNAGRPTPIYLLPGNHDASNAIGFHRQLTPPTDASSIAGIYNLMMHPAKPADKATFDYAKDRIGYSVTGDGIHYVFAGIWPDSKTRAWIAADIDTLAPGTPVIIFAHDPPEVEAKHFINPNGKHDINARDKFENLLTDTASVKSAKQEPVDERRQLANFVKAHPSIKAYFHGHTNYSEFYWWKDGKGQDILPVFRVDSPMKGELSATDESLLSFTFVTIDTDKRLLTAREYLWNSKQAHWGKSMTIKLDR